MIFLLFLLSVNDIASLKRKFKVLERSRCYSSNVNNCLLSWMNDPLKSSRFVAQRLCTITHHGYCVRLSPLYLFQPKTAFKGGVKRKSNKVFRSDSFSTFIGL